MKKKINKKNKLKLMCIYDKKQMKQLKLMDRKSRAKSVRFLMPEDHTAARERTTSHTVNISAIATQIMDDEDHDSDVSNLECITPRNATGLTPRDKSILSPSDINSNQFPISPRSKTPGPMIRGRKKSNVKSPKPNDNNNSNDNKNENKNKESNHKSRAKSMSTMDEQKKKRSQSTGPHGRRNTKKPHSRSKTNSTTPRGKGGSNTASGETNDKYERGRNLSMSRGTGTSGRQSRSRSRAHSRNSSNVSGVSHGSSVGYSMDNIYQDTLVYKDSRSDVFQEKKNMVENNKRLIRKYDPESVDYEGPGLPKFCFDLPCFVLNLCVCVCVCKVLSKGIMFFFALCGVASG